MSGKQIRLWSVDGHQSGQAAVLSALALFSMVVFLAMATNAGILVNDRIRMQDTADLTAYAGAFEQARQMNIMAELNSEIYAAVQRTRTVLNYGPSYLGVGEAPDEAPIFYWRQPACSCLDYSPSAESYIRQSQRQLDNMVTTIEVVNRLAPTSARKAATYTASENFLGPSTSSRHLDFFEDQSISPTSGDELVDLEQVDDTKVGYNYLRSCRCCDGCCLYPQVRVTTMYTWLYKNPSQGRIFFPAMVKGVPWKNFLDFGSGKNSYFGPDAVGAPGGDMLYGYAAAKPFEGIIGTENPDNGPGTERPEQAVYPPSDEYVDYFQAEYRARIAGIHEEMGTETQSIRMADLIAGDQSEPQFRDKTDYFTH